MNSQDYMIHLSHPGVSNVSTARAAHALAADDCARRGAARAKYAPRARTRHSAGTPSLESQSTNKSSAPWDAGRTRNGASFPPPPRASTATREIAPPSPFSVSSGADHSGAPAQRHAAAARRPPAPSHLMRAQCPPTTAPQYHHRRGRPTATHLTSVQTCPRTRELSSSSQNDSPSPEGNAAKGRSARRPAKEQNDTPSPEGNVRLECKRALRRRRLRHLVDVVLAERDAVTGGPLGIMGTTGFTGVLSSSFSAKRTSLVYRPSCASRSKLVPASASAAAVVEVARGLLLEGDRGAASAASAAGSKELLFGRRPPPLDLGPWRMRRLISSAAAIHQSTAPPPPRTAPRATALSRDAAVRATTAPAFLPALRTLAQRVQAPVDLCLRGTRSPRAPHNSSRDRGARRSATRNRRTAKPSTRVAARQRERPIDSDRGPTPRARAAGRRRTNTSASPRAAPVRAVGADGAADRDERW